MKDKYRSVIIGCGRIAGGYDGPNDKNILTHAHALTRHKNTVLSGVYDISFAKAASFAGKWSTSAYRDINTLFKVIRPEIVFVCVPDKEHIKTLDFIKKFKPLAVICEKPLGVDISSARRIVSEYGQKRIALSVNYTRRFYPAIRKIEKAIKNGDYGKLINAAVFYTKGILHNGSHAVDLLRFFFKDISESKALSSKVDFAKGDPTLDAMLYFREGAKAHFIGLDERKFSIFEIDLLFSGARIILLDGGTKYSLQKVIPHADFPGYKCLGAKEILPTQKNKALLSLVDNVVNHIEKGEPLLSSAGDALETKEVCCRLIKGYKDGR